MEEIMTLALKNGIWAVLFCFLFFYMLKDAGEREKKYTATIVSLTESLKRIDNIKAVCDDIYDTQASFHDEHQVICNISGDIKEEIKRLQATGGVR